MIVKAIKTRRVVADSGSLENLLDDHLKELDENSILVITSKVAALCEGRVVPADSVEKKELVKKESDYFLPDNLSKYGFSFTITNHTLIPAAGIDLSNGNGNFVLWPADPQATANRVRDYLTARFGLKNVGVILTDSTARPLHYGTEGVGIAYSGIAPTKNYIGTPDLFGRKLEVSIANILDALAAAAVVVMGEGTESTPLAVILDVPFVEFLDHNPTDAELKAFYLEHTEDDLFAPFLQNMPWQEGGHKE